MCLGGRKGKGFPIKKAVRFGLRSRRIRDTEMTDEQHSDESLMDKVSEKLHNRSTSFSSLSSDDENPPGSENQRSSSSSSDDENPPGSENQRSSSSSSDDENPPVSENQRSSSSSSDDENAPGSGNQRSSSSSSDDENPPGSENQRSSSSSSDDENPPVGRKDADWCRWKRPASILGGVTLLWILFECMEYHFLTFVCVLLFHSLAILFIWINSFAILKRSLHQKIAICEDVLHDCFSDLYTEVKRRGFDYVDAVRVYLFFISRMKASALNSFAGLCWAAFVTYMKTSILVVAHICVIAVIGSCRSCLLAVIGRCCRCLLMIFSFMMISDLRQGAVNIMASEFYGAFADLREAVTGTNKKKIVLVVAVIWVNAFIGSCSSFPLTIFSFMIISSVVLLKRSLHQKIAICEDVLEDRFSYIYPEVRRRGLDYYHGQRFDLLFISHMKASALNRVAGLCWAAFVTYMKTSILVVASLWLLFVIGSWRDFLTLALMLVVTHTVLFLYERNIKQIDSFARKVSWKAKEQYKVIDAKILKKIPRGLAKDKKHL